MKRQPRSSQRSAKPLRTVSIIGTGSYVPEKILTNADLARMVNTTDDWITTRTGIKSADRREDNHKRHGCKAALRRSAAKIAPKRSIGFSSQQQPDMLFPRQPVSLEEDRSNQRRFLDVSQTAGISFRPGNAQQFITSLYTYCPCCSGREMTSITNWTDRNTCVFWRRDGALFSAPRGAHG